MSDWRTSGAPRGADYDRRWEELAARGQGIHGEADFVEALGVRSVFDAGCGTGRVAIELARHGIEVVGVDEDPAMLATAREKAPALRWELADLATVALGRTFDAVVMAGNVVIFLAPGSEEAVMGNMTRHLLAGGLVVAGFSLRRPLDDYDALMRSCGFELLERFATWDRDPWVEGGDYAVSVHHLA